MVSAGSVNASTYLSPRLVAHLRATGAPPIVWPRSERPMTTDEICEQFDLKVRAGIFRPVIRYVTGNDPEERLAEAVAQTFEMFQRYALRGVVLPDAILAHHCRLRATDLGRAFVRGGQRKRDVFDPRNYHEGRLELLRVDSLPTPDGDCRGEEDAALVVGLVDGLAQDPTPVLIGAIDLGRWVRALPARDRVLLSMRAAGHTLAEIGEAQGSSTSKVFARLRRLGTELAARSGVTIPARPRAYTA